MTHGESLVLTIEATQRSLEERLGEALVLHQDRHRPRDHYAATDAFIAATSRHLAAAEAVLIDQVRDRIPSGADLCHEYLRAARQLEHTLALIKGRLYGEAYAVHLAWPELWEAAHTKLDEHNLLERRLVRLLVKHGDPMETDGLARRVFQAEATGPTRPHPHLPHTGVRGRVARRIWTWADRFWDNAEGRVVPEPVRPIHHRHDSLMAQYLVADPRFDADAPMIDHGHDRRTA